MRGGRWGRPGDVNALTSPHLRRLGVVPTTFHKGVHELPNVLAQLGYLATCAGWNSPAPGRRRATGIFGIKKSQSLCAIEHLAIFESADTAAGGGAHCRQQLALQPHWRAHDHARRTQ